MPRSVLGYVIRHSRAGQLCVTVITMALLPLMPVPLELQRRLLDEAVAAGDLTLLARLAVLYAAALGLAAGLKFAMRLQRELIAAHVVRSLRLSLYECLVPERASVGGPAASGPLPDRGTMVTMTTGEVQKLGGFAGSALSEPLLQVGTILFVLGYMFWVQPLVATVALALYVPQLIIVPLAQRRMNRLTELIALSTRQLGEVINKDEAGTATKDDPARRFTDLTERILWIRKRFVLTKNLMKLTNNFLIALGPFGVTVYGGYLVIAGETEIGVILAFVSGLERLSGPFRSVIGLYSEINFARTRYAMLLDAMPAHERGAADGRAPA